MHALYPDIARQLIAGYVTVLPLSPQQRNLLAELLPLVHLDFALSEVEYFHAITHNPVNVELAWSEFFLGHAAWLDSTPGQQVLAVIREPAATPTLA
jgi:Ser/Thr protein kinase RdoA (MazF antagonist)